MRASVTLALRSEVISHEARERSHSIIRSAGGMGSVAVVGFGLLRVCATGARALGAWTRVARPGIGGKRLKVWRPLPTRERRQRAGGAGANAACLQSESIVLRVNSPALDRSSSLRDAGSLSAN